MPSYSPLVPDVKKGLDQLLQDEPDEEKKLNIRAFISAFEKGEEIRPDEMFCKGRKIRIQDWQPRLGPFFMFRLVSVVQVLSA